MKKLILFAGLWCALQLSTMGEYLRVYSLDSLIAGIARDAVSELANGNFAALFDRFDNSLKSAMPAAQLPELWQSITSQVGTFRSQQLLRQEKSGTHEVVFVSCRFVRASLDIELVFDDEQKIAGLFFGPSSLLMPAAPTSEIVDQDFRETLKNIWKGSQYAGSFISRFFTMPVQPSDVLKPLRIYSFFHEEVPHK